MPIIFDVADCPTRTVTVTGVRRFTIRLRAVAALLRLARWLTPKPLELRIEFPEPLPEPRPPEDL